MGSSLFDELMNLRWSLLGGLSFGAERVGEFDEWMGGIGAENGFFRDLGLLWAIVLGLSYFYVCHW